MSSAEVIIKRIRELPPLSPTTLAIIEMLAEDHFQMKELVQLIQKDISLSIECLKVVNSASYGLSRPVETIQRAVTFLGTQKLTEIALRTGVSKIIQVKLNGYGAMEMDLWEHSLKSAIAARLIAHNIDKNVNQELAYAAALIHDIGKVVFSSFLENKVLELNRKERKELNFLEVEHSLLSSNHAEVGAMLAQEWNLPKALEEAIRHHHNPSLASPDYKGLVLVTHLADLLAMLCGSGTGMDSLFYELDPLAQDMLEKDPNWAEEEVWKLVLNLNYEFNQATQTEPAAG